MNTARIKKLNAVKKLDEAKRASERYEIFVAGPFIDVAKDKNHAANTASTGTRLRFSVYEYYRQTGHNLYLGEDVELRTIGERHYGSTSNATFYERHYIKDNIDALLVFPAGPGVFCEFGDWATTEATCRKMLVVIDKQFEGVRSYINDGTAKAAEHFGATITYCDYEDISSVISVCDKFIDRLAIRDRVNQLYER